MEHRSTILIVDDEALGRETLEGVLFGQGYELAFAGNGPEALTKAAELVPDLILLDVMMPGMDGFEACRRLRADRVLADVPIIMVTALDDRDSCLEGIEAGADDFVTKPFDRLKLRARVRTITRLNRYRRLLAERIRFEWVVEHARDGYLVLNNSGSVLYANPQARLYLDLPPSDTDVGIEPDSPFLEMASSRYHCEPQEAWATWGMPSADGSPATRYLVRPESSEANAFWLQVDVLDLPSGPHERQMIRLHDVTAEVTRQRDMRGFHEAVRHKMRTPLTPLLGNLSLLAKRGDKMPVQDILQLTERALRGSERLRDTLEDILSYLNAAGLSRSAGEFDLGQLEPTVNEICSNLGIASCIVSCSPELRGSRIQLSPQAVELVLWEILENAQKFHPQQAPSIEVCASRSTPTEMRLRIQDDGVTVSPEHLGQMWTPYYQGEKYFTGEAKGTGLGLATVATLVWEVGGTCRASNRQDVPGVVIDLTLPLKMSCEAA
jgi:two-component system cell cycle response regulator